jgi:hypothetical protein
VIRNVCIHVTNEQPLLADLYTLPSASDAGLVCTNVRGLDGKRPVFVDSTSSTFFFPYHVVRFLEIPAGAVRATTLVGPGNGELDDLSDEIADEEPGGSEIRLAGPAGDGEPAVDEEPEADIEIDESLLQRIRDI